MALDHTLRSEVRLNLIADRRDTSRVSQPLRSLGAKAEAFQLKPEARLAGTFVPNTLFVALLSADATSITA